MACLTHLPVDGRFIRPGFEQKLPLTLGRQSGDHLRWRLSVCRPEKVSWAQRLGLRIASQHSFMTLGHARQRTRNTCKFCALRLATLGVDSIVMSVFECNLGSSCAFFVSDCATNMAGGV
eukprot:56158-Amphidinium_carterae.1